MGRTHRYSDDLDDNDILKPGQKLRVSLDMMDATQRQIAQHGGKLECRGGADVEDLMRCRHQLPRIKKYFREVKALVDVSGASDERIARIVALTKQTCGDASASVTDAFGNAGSRRPGARFAAVDAAAIDAVRKARADYLNYLQDAWRGDAWSKAKPKPDKDEDEEDFDDQEGGNQEGAKSGRKRKRKTQSRDPQGRETGTEETEETFDNHMRRAQAARAHATDEAYAAAEREQRDAYKRQ
jgi:hypothetical protein